MATKKAAQPAKPDLKALSYSELKNLKEETEALMSQRKEEVRLDLLRRWTTEATEAGFTVQEVVSPPKPKRTRKRTSDKLYANPSDPKMTWNNVGRCPNWLKNLESEGHDRSEFLIS